MVAKTVPPTLCFTVILAGLGGVGGLRFSGERLSAAGPVVL